MNNDQPQNEPSPTTPEVPDDDDADDLEPTLTTPGGRFWDIPLDPQQQKALSATRFWWE